MLASFWNSGDENELIEYGLISILLSYLVKALNSLMYRIKGTTIAMEFGAFSISMNEEEIVLQLLNNKMFSLPNRIFSSKIGVILVLFCFRTENLLHLL